MSAEPITVICPECEQRVAVVARQSSVWSALDHHTCTPPPCETCHDVEFLLKTGETDMSALGLRLAKTPAAIDKHLYRCNRNDLTRRITGRQEAATERKTMSAQPLHAVPPTGKRPHPRDLVDHDDKRIARAAQKVMAAVDALDQAWDANAASAELRAKRDRLKKQLAEVEAQLRGGPKPKRDTKAIRAWAAANNIDVAPSGIIPKHVVAAYEVAQS